VNSREWFADTGYWIALANARDDLHVRAREWSRRLPPHLVTTEPILLEVGDALTTSPLRRLAVALIADVRADPAILVVRLDERLLVRGLELFAARADKEWGLTDCISFVVMQDRGIAEALAYDEHVLQAGFRALLRE